MKLKFCNNNNSVFGIDDNGNNVSYSIKAEEYKQWLEEGNTPEPEFTEEEIRLQEINTQITEAKQYLADTGWIWEKYSRNVLSLKDMTQEEFNTKYQDIIIAQEEARLNINKYEQELLALETKGE